MFLIELRHTSAGIDGIVVTHEGAPREFTLGEALAMIAMWAPTYRARTRILPAGSRLPVEHVRKVTNVPVLRPPFAAGG